MKKFETLEEFRQYNRERSKAYYDKHKGNAEYKEKHRAYQRERYQKMVAELKAKAGEQN